MESPIVLVLLSFIGIATIVAACGLLMRDLVFGGPKEETTILKRLPLARHAVRPTGPVSHLDHSFNRLVTESGTESTPWGTLLLLLCSGLLFGGAAFIYLEDPLIAALAFCIGMALPLPYIMYLRSEYLKQVREQMPDALDLLSRSLRAGNSLDQGIEMTGEKTSEPLAKEFRRSAKHLHMGLSLPATMRALMSRVPLMDMKIFATTLAVHRHTGGNLSLTLERMAAVIRDRLVFHRQLRATTAAGRFSAAMISVIGPLLFIYMFFFQREYAMKLISLPLGQMLLVIAVVLEVIGLLWVARLMRTIE